MKETLIEEPEKEISTNTNNREEHHSDDPLIVEEPKKSNIEEDIYVVYINNPQLNDKHETNKINTSKYKWFNFFSKILMEQFSRLANVYFLIIAVLQSIKDISYSGGNPIILMPLSFVVSLNGLKDIFEDYKRKKSDKKENQSECYIYNKSNGFEKKKWLDIKLGDIVKVNNNQQFPADLLLLSTSDENGICYIETKNLDGETNLKFRQANKTLHDSIYKNSDNQEYLSNLKYVCITKPPNEFIYKFDATLYETENDGSIVDRNKFELFSNKSFLLRGCSLRQTEYVIGVAIYIGPHTKSMINSPDLKSKHSSVEVEMNKQLIAIFVIQLFIALFTSIIYSVIYGKKFFGLKEFYFLKPKTKKAYKGGVLELMYKIGGTWILICTNFVPISLLVTMESIKFFQGMFMEWDIDMYDKESLSGCKVQSSTLNEELGQVKYVFSDKTGTLTKNYMKYKMMSIGDKIYGTFINELNNQNNNHEIANQNSDNSTSDNDTDNDNENLNVKNDNNIINEDNENKKKEFVVKDKYGDIPNVEFVDKNNSLKEDMNNEDKKELINEFMLCLSLCNTVLIDTKKKQESGEIDYQSSSPDEKALVCFARSQGYILTNRALDDTITLEINGEEKYFKLLNTLEYSSERKRMSVVIKTPSNRYIVYTKGADSMIESLLSGEERASKLLDSTSGFLKQFATSGLRTLMIAYKEISEDTYNKWNDKYVKTKTNANHTEEEINKLYDELENNFKLIGSTAIEDELQDNVDEIINCMMQTGMKVWMLTGDKLDTAKNIAYSCKLFQKDMNIIEVKENSTIEELKKDMIAITKSDIFDNENINVGLLVASGELEKIFSDNFLISLFFEICVSCLTVVCSRVSPKQKGQLVNLIKKTDKAITLAVGDGANDVGMINEANVGVGIQGKEGTQAARASDYAIKEFSHLKKLLFFHGRESYRKNSWVILYNFYKNILFVTPMIWNGFITLFSGLTIYDPFIHQLINVVFTSVPPVWFGVFNYEYTTKELLSNPRYYIQGIYYKCFHFKRFGKIFATATIEACIIFFMAHFWFNKGNSDGKVNEFYSIGSVIYGAVVVVSNLKVVIDMSYHDYFSITLISLSVILYYIILIIFASGSFYVTKLYIIGDFVNTIWNLKFFFYSILVCTFCCFLEIFVTKAPVLYGLVIEGKLLPPYKRKRYNRHNFEFEVVDPKAELDTYFSQSMAKERNEGNKNQDEEDNILK